MERPPNIAVDVDSSLALGQKTHQHSISIIADAGHNREPNCALCGKRAWLWAIEISFPVGENKRLAFGPLDYPGPLMGACLIHERELAEAMAQGVFMDRPEVGMAQPESWRVTFTDGSAIDGHIYSAVPEGLKVEVQESYAPKEDSPTE